MAKKLFIGDNEDIHYGGVSIENFNTCSVEEMKSSLSKKGDKKFWRCTVCNDLYFANQLFDHMDTHSILKNLNSTLKN